MNNKYCKVCGYNANIETNKCPVCGQNNFYSICDLSLDDLIMLKNISSDNNFLQAMIDLKEKDPIEYQLKISQFRTQIEQQEQLKQTKEEQSKPHCPHCHSTNIKPISGLNRGASIAMWGIFSKKINKSFECLNCKYTW